MNLTQLLADCRREVQASAGAVPERANADPMALAQWRLYAAMEESLRLHADRAGRRAGLLLRGRAVPPAPERRQGGAGLGSARPAADRRAGAAGAGASPGGTRAAGSPGCAALRARGRGNAHRAARRRAGRAAAVGEVQPHQGRQRPPTHHEQRRGPGRARRRHRPRPRSAGGAAPARADRTVKPRLPGLAPACRRRPRRGADDPGGEHGRAHAHGLAARSDADPPAVHAQRVRPRARASPRAPTAQARLPPAVHDQSRRRAARTGARLRPLRPGARVPGAPRRDGRRRAVQPVQGLDLPDAARPRTRPQPRGALRSGRLLRRVDRVRGRLQGRPRRVPPARAVDLEPAARTRHLRQGAQVPHRQHRRHGPAGRHELRVADGDPVRVRRSGSHRRAAEPIRRGARQLHAGHRRPQRLGQDADRKHPPVALPGDGRTRVRDRPRRPLRDPHAADRRRAADRDRRRRLPLRAEPVGRARPGQGLPGEDRVPARAAPGDDGRAGRAADRA